MDVFLSFSSKDAQIAEEIYHVLNKIGTNVWFAKENLMPGMKFPEEIQKGLEQCKCLVLIASKNSQATGQVENEISNAIEKDVPIIPYKIDGSHKKLEETLYNYQWIEAAGDPSGFFDELAESVCSFCGMEVPEVISHELDDLKRIKPIKRISGKFAFFTFIAELLLAALYFTMNISLLFLILCGAVLLAGLIYPLSQMNKCALLKCRRKKTGRKSHIKLKKGKFIRKFGLCPEHKYTLDMEKYKPMRSGNNFILVGVILIAGIMAFLVVKYDITIDDFLEVKGSGFTFTKMEADLGTAQSYGKSFAITGDSAICVKNDGTVCLIRGDGEFDGADQWDGVTAVAASDSHIAALRFDGTVLYAGDNTSGHCGEDTFSCLEIKSVDVGYEFTVALTEDGRIAGCGNNDKGQLDFGGISGVRQISAGTEHVLALKDDGTVAAFGGNNYSQCEVSDWVNIVQVSAGGNISASLTGDGTVVTTAEESLGWTDIVYVCAGDSLVAGLTKEGRVKVACGSAAVAEEISEWRDIIALDVCGTNIIGLKSDFTLVALGVDGEYTAEEVAKAGAPLNSDAIVLYYAKRLSAGDGYALYLNKIGRPEASAQSPAFEFMDSGALAQIKINSNTAACLKEDGSVEASRVSGSEIDFSGWEDIVMIDMTDTFAVGIKSDHTIIFSGSDDYGQSEIAGLKGVAYVSAADTHVVAVRDDGSVTAAGDNTYGQCCADEWSGIKFADTGKYHTVAVKHDGRVLACGKNDSGQCEVAEWEDIVSAAAGDDFTLGLKRNGTYVFAGQGDLSRFDEPEDVIAIDAYGDWCFFLTKSGKVYNFQIS